MYEGSVAETVSDYTAHGYTGSFRAEDEGLRDVVSGTVYRPERLRIDDLARFEGDSDPGDSAVVFALGDSLGGVIGTYVVPFGPQMDRLDADAVRRLNDARRGRPRSGRPERGASPRRSPGFA
jgi:hypothetical protein